MKKTKYIITFAGPIGSSKTPISNYLSTLLNLPIYNNDAVRTEVIEDLGKFNENIFLKRRNERIDFILNKGESFILDASIDRVWGDYRKKIHNMNYEVFIISLDFSKEFLKKLYKAKNYDKSFTKLDKFFNDHLKFLENYSEDVSLHLKDTDFKNRLDLSLSKAKNWIGKF